MSDGSSDENMPELDFSGTCMAPAVTFVVEEVPLGMVEFVRSKCRADRLVISVLENAARKVLRRLRHDVAEGRRARWTKWWLAENQARTKRWLGTICDEVLRDDHLIQVCTHDVHGELPDYLTTLEISEGALVIEDPKEVTPSFGSTGFMEATPPQLLRWDHLYWVRNWTGDLGDVSPLQMKPRIWDLTAGSGTGQDYFGHNQLCEVISTDLTPANGQVIKGDCRMVGFMEQHRPKRYKFVGPSRVVTTPDIVLLDPPSPGSPWHSDIYGGERDHNDLARLTREMWIFTVADIAVRAVRCLADGGMASLLVRCGRRERDGLVPDPSVLEDLKFILRDRVMIVHEMPLAYRNVRSQTSLGTARLPAVHLTLTRPK